MDELNIDIPENTLIIRNFKELMDEISYAWDFNYEMYKDEFGIYHVHKLSIGQNWAQYKTTLYHVYPGVYEDLEIFYQLVRGTYLHD
jgi:hypothetical protein